MQQQKKVEKIRDKKQNLVVPEILVVVVNRGQGDNVREFLKNRGINILSSSFGEGTANTYLQNLLGLSVEKEIVFAVINMENKNEFLDDMEKEILLPKKNMGIAFTIPLKSITKNSLNKVK